MKKILLAAILASGCMTSLHAQSEMSDTKKEKTTDHFFGVQLNDLLRQVISLNNSTAAANTNPFLFTYNVNNHKSGWGLRAGVGLTVNSSSSNDNVTKRTSNINDYQMRFGVERAYKLTGKWTAGVGIDGVVKLNDDKTSAVTNSTFIVSTNTQSTTTTYGGGAMAWLRYSITDRILIGTETSFYYLQGKNKQTITTSDTSPFSNASETNTNDGVTEGKISVPVVFYISIKF